MRRGKALVLYSLLATLLLANSIAANAQSCMSCSTSGCSKVTMQVFVPNQPQLNVILPWITNLNVLTAMSNATFVLSTFKFTSTNYCPWGAFITSIQGYTPPSGSYWQLSVNGTPSSFGASTQLLRPNDVFAFRVVKYSDVEAHADLAKSHQHLLYKEHVKRTSKP